MTNLALQQSESNFIFTVYALIAFIIAAIGGLFMVMKILQGSMASWFISLASGAGCDGVFVDWRMAWRASGLSGWSGYGAAGQAEIVKIQHV